MQQIGDYNLIEKIGAVGMGEVWLAENVHTRLDYAIKLLPREATSDKNFVARFFDEGRVMAELDHPRIVRVHHVGHDKDSGRYYLVMDYIVGPQGRPQSLHDALEQKAESRLPEVQVRKWAIQIAEGLAYAHGRGVVPRDIKPANILIDKEGNARITDFGLAKAVGHEFVMSQIHQSIQHTMGGTLSDTPTLRRPGPRVPDAGEMDASLGDQETIPGDGGSSHRTTAESLLGTYDYMSPEQRGELSGVEVGPPSDIYAFGVMLYRVLTGRRPAGRAKPASAIVPGVSKSWDAITDRCLEHQPRDRFANGTQLLTVLKRVGHSGSGVARLARAAVWVAVLVCVIVAGYVGLNRLREPSKQHIQPMPSVPAPDAAPASAVTVPFRIEVAPAGAMVVLTHDRLGRVVGEKAPEAGLTLDLEPGTYHILVTADGYRAVQQDIEVSEAKSSWQVKLSEHRGELLVVSHPGVSIAAAGTDGKSVPLGQTDAQGQLSITTLREGNYHLTLALTDYASASTEVTIQEGRPAEVKKLLEPLPGELTIGSGRSGLEICEGGQRIGKANEAIKLAAGEHELELRCPGFRTERIGVTIRPNRPVLRQSPALVAESGSVRISAVSAAQGDDYLTRQKAQVRIDGGAWREVALPHVEEGLSCEGHQVEVKVSSYTQAGSQQVSVRDGQVSAVEFHLAPEEGSVRITSNATGAEVYDASGKKLGSVEESLSLSPFVTHRLTVKATRHKPVELTVRIDRPGMDAGTRQVVLEQQRIPDDLVEVANAQDASLDGLAVGSREAQERQRRAVAEFGLPLEVKTARTGIVFRLVPAGSFTMGSPRTEQDAIVRSGVERKYVEDETQHEVTLSEPFYCGKYEVTQGQWESVMGSKPSYFKNAGRDAPVEQVSWEDCQEFAKKLCQMEGVPEGTYRLLTEAEWEYACRAGTQTALYNGDLAIKGSRNAPALDPIAWYGGNSGVQYAGGYDSSGWSEKQDNHKSAGTHPVGQKLANGYGLYDMHGNVWEWCQDWLGQYPSGSATDPLGPTSGGHRVNRGGGWLNFARYCRSAIRNGSSPDYRSLSVGLRLARTTPSYP